MGDRRIHVFLITEMLIGCVTLGSEVMDISDEPIIFYECMVYLRSLSTYAANCLLACRLIEKDVRFVQLYHTWLGINTTTFLIKQKGRVLDVDQGMLSQSVGSKQRDLDNTMVMV